MATQPQHLPFANSDLEERMLSSEHRSDAIAASICGHAGSRIRPVNTTEIIIDSIDLEEKTEDTVLNDILVAINNLPNS